MRFSEPAFFRAFAVVLVLLFGLVCGNCWGGMARAQSPELGPSPLQLALALDIARTAANEASLRATDRDVDLVYEATRGHADNDAARLRWLRRHSACTNPRGDCNHDGVINELDMRAADARPGNADWTRRLRWNDERPSTLPESHWDVEVWQRLRARALADVLADVPTGVCGGVPIRTWGNAGDFEASAARARSAGLPAPLVRIDCGAANFGGSTPAILRRHRARARLAPSADPS